MDLRLLFVDFLQLLFELFDQFAVPFSKVDILLSALDQLHGLAESIPLIGHDCTSYTYTIEEQFRCQNMSSDTMRTPAKILHDRLMIVARKVANMRKVHLSIPIADKIDSALNAIARLGFGFCRVLVLRLNGFRVMSYQNNEERLCDQSFSFAELSYYCR